MTSTPKSVLPLLGAEHATCSVVCTATTLPCKDLLTRHLFFAERPRWFADLLRDHRRGCIHEEPPPLQPPIPDPEDMQRYYFRPASWSCLPTICPQFPPVQCLLPAAALDPASLKALMKVFTEVEGWSSVRARGIPCLEPPLAANLCPSAGWREIKKLLPPNRLQDSSPVYQKDTCLSYGCERTRSRLSDFVYLSPRPRLYSKKKPLPPSATWFGPGSTVSSAAFLCAL